MIQVVNRALDIVEYVAKRPEKVFSLTEVSDQLKLNHGTCANIMKTLVTRKYIEQIGAKKGYRLGTKAYEITGNNNYSNGLIAAAKIPMQTLSLTLNESCLLSIRDGDRRIAIYTVEGDNDLQVRNKREKSVYEASTGRILISQMSDEELQLFTMKYGLPDKATWAKAGTLGKLKKELREITEKKFSIQTAPSHITGIAVPLIKHGAIVASLGIFLPEIRLKEKNEKKIIEEMFQTAKKINLNLEAII